MTTTPSVHPKNRRWARRLALQALYQWELTQQSPENIAQQYQLDENIGKADEVYFQELLRNIPEDLSLIESYLKRYIDRSLKEIDPIELTVLRLATYELLKRLDVPYRVILNEALELEKMFGATEGHRFVNGILDKIAREVRHAEIKSASGNG